MGAWRYLEAKLRELLPRAPMLEFVWPAGAGQSC